MSLFFFVNNFIEIFDRIFEREREREKDGTRWNLFFISLAVPDRRDHE